jgi:hypothetical protein
MLAMSGWEAVVACIDLARVLWKYFVVDAICSSYCKEHMSVHRQ